MRVLILEFVKAGCEQLRKSKQMVANHILFLQVLQYINLADSVMLVLLKKLGVKSKK